MKQLSQNISSTCRGDNVDIKYATTTTTSSSISDHQKMNALNSNFTGNEFDSFLIPMIQ